MVRGEECGMAGGRPRCKQSAGEGLTADLAVRAHPEHAAHVGDAGGVEAQWLVERRRALRRVKRRGVR